MKTMDSETDLLHFIVALHSSSGFSGGLHGGEQQGDEHADDGDNDEQFDEREGFARVADYVGAVRRNFASFA